MEARTACLTPEPSFDKSSSIAFYGAPKGAEDAKLRQNCNLSSVSQWSASILSALLFPRERRAVGP